MGYRGQNQARGTSWIYRRHRVMNLFLTKTLYPRHHSHPPSLALAPPQHPQYEPPPLVAGRPVPSELSPRADVLYPSLRPPHLQRTTPHQARLQSAVPDPGLPNLPRLATTSAWHLRIHPALDWSPFTTSLIIEVVVAVVILFPRTP